MNISFIIPSRNNLKYLKQAYRSIRKYYKECEIVLLDDASTDGTWSWMQEMINIDDHLLLYQNKNSERVGHTVLYDVGVGMCSNPIFSILHADMIVTPNYVENILKHLRPGVVVAGTRIEPPLHPPGPEKIVADFGIEPETFQEKKFLQAVEVYQTENKDKTTEGIFAPWTMYRGDFIAIGGHDKLFAPMELEDSDIFNRMFLAGYKFIQARDAFVYHMTCRGSRFKDGVEVEQVINLQGGGVWNKPKDSDEYLELRKIKFKEWWRKWHTGVLHNEEMLPIVAPRYSTAFIITNCNQELIEVLEPWCDEMWIDCPFEEYVVKEQPGTLFDLSKKFFELGSTLPTTDVTLLFDGTSFSPRHLVDFIQNLPFVIQQTGEKGIFNWDRFVIRINNLQAREMVQPWFRNVF